VDLSLSSDKKGLIPDTLRDAEFTRKLFSDLNCDVLGTPSEGKILILNDSDEEEDVREEITADADGAPSSVVGIPTSTASTTDTEEALKGVQDDNTDDQAPDQEAYGGNNGRDEASSP
jgi:hydrogenase maturation factor